MRPTRADPFRRAQLAVASLGVLLTSADTYVVVLALPDIMTGVGVGVDELQRAAPIVSAFLLGYVIVLPLIGRLSDLHGRVPVLVGCLAVFAFGSLCTASADGLGVAVAGRALQGLGAGGLVPATLALVADRWTPDQRGVPLGMVGAMQEVGTVVGPLYAGAVLAVSGWRTIFWVNLAGAVLLALGLRAVTRPRPGRRPPRRWPAAMALLSVAAAVLVLTEPTVLATHVTLGRAYVPLVGTSVVSSPLVIGTVLLAAAAATVAVDRATVLRTVREVDVIGATLAAVALSGVVLSFATADPSRQVVDDRAPLLLAGSAGAAALFVFRQRRARNPLVPRQALRSRVAIGALAVNVFVGAALVAALVNVPLFARATRYPDSQWDASLVLLRLLIALPVGALLGGWLCARVAPRLVAATAMGLASLGLAAMTRWDATSLGDPTSTVVLLATGLGFGLAIAPVNQALLGATPTDAHGLAAAMLVVARTVGMLVGLSVLTAVGLRVFHARQRDIGSPLTLCPRNPGDCPSYDIASKAALLSELHAIFWGAALCAAVAAAVAAATLRQPDRADTSLDPDEHVGGPRRP